MKKELIFENSKYRVYKYNHWYYKADIKFDIYRKFLFFWFNLLTVPTELDWKYYVENTKNQ